MPATPRRGSVAREKADLLPERKLGLPGPPIGSVSGVGRVIVRGQLRGTGELVVRVFDPERTELLAAPAICLLLVKGTSCAVAVPYPEMSAVGIDVFACHRRTMSSFNLPVRGSGGYSPR